MCDTVKETSQRSLAYASSQGVVKPPIHHLHMSVLRTDTWASDPLCLPVLPLTLNKANLSVLEFRFGKCRKKIVPVVWRNKWKAMFLVEKVAVRILLMDTVK